MVNIKDLYFPLKEVYSSFKYWIISVVLAVAFFSFNSLIHNWSTVISSIKNQGFFFSIKLFFMLTTGFHHSIELHSYIPLVFLSLLFGILFTLIVYKAKLNIVSTDKKTGVFSTIGVFIAAFIPGCAACGVGLVSAIGLSGFFINFLPFHGIELSFISVVLLLIAIFLILKNMYICKNLKGGFSN